MDFATLYDDDLETWAELQVEALRRLAATPGPWTNAVDVENVIEEIESFGASERRAVESLLANAFAHALKIIADPSSLSIEQWRRDVRLFLSNAQARIRPAMRSRIDMDEVWTEACGQAEAALDAFDRTLPQLSARCPFTFDEVMDRMFNPLADPAVMLAAPKAQA